MPLLSNNLGLLRIKDGLLELGESDNEKDNMCYKKESTYR